MTVVITPVGTSLFTNGSKTNSSIKNGFDRIEDKPEDNWNENNRYISSLKTACEQFIENIQNNPESASAELQSSGKIQDKLKSEITVHLLASDTIASRLAAEILRDHINSNGSVLDNSVTAVFNADPSIGQIDVIRNLQVENSQDFSRKGMPKLFERINYIKDWEAVGSQNLAINITGGYGATLPYLTIFAQLEGVPLYYNFEGKDELITIPRVPLAIDTSLIKSHAGVLTQIADRIDDPKCWRAFKDKNKHALKELGAFIWEDDELGAELSPMGNIFWNDYLKDHFIVKLPLGQNARYPNHGYNEISEKSNNFKKAIDNAIQDLHRRLKETLGSPCPNSEKCYKTIRELGHNHDLNHTGQISGRNIFIFHTQVGNDNSAQLRMLYTFEVNNSVIRGITVYAILYQKYENFNHSTYDTEWKDQFGERNSNGCLQKLPEIDFDSRTLDAK